MHHPRPYYLLPSDEELVNGYVDEELGSPTSPLVSSVSRSWPTHVPYGWSKWRLNHRFQRVCLRKSFVLFLSGAGVAIIVLSVLYLGLVSSAFIPVSVFFGVSTSGDASNLPPPMLSHSLLRGDCLEAWVAHGEVCNHLDLSSVEVLDAVWSWVNGSDPRHQASRSFWDDKPVEYSIAVTQQPPSSVRLVSSSQAALDEAPKSALRKDKRTESRSPPSKRLSRQSMPNAQINEKWFRDHDELRYSMRSVYQHLTPYLRTAHILATDFSHPFVAPAVLARSRPSASNQFIDIEGHVNSSLVGVSDIFKNPDSATNGSWREGQWPQWLDADSGWMRKESDSGWKGGVRVHHHWNLFSVPPGLRRQESGKDDLSTNESSVVDELHWKERVLPTFNSFAIESQIANIPDLSENFIYNNDDFFLGLDLSLSDFVTPLFGTVFRMLGDLRVEPLENSRADPSGEWRALHRSNWVLSQRFGARKRPYIIHATKTLSTPLLQETRMMFPEAFALTATHRFRAKGHDINAVFLTNHMTVERHREALLWSFVVARGDKDADGILDEAEITDLMSIVEHGTTNAQKPKVVTLPFRKTLHDGRPDSILQSVGLPRPEQTGYLFSSRDGYPYIGGLTGFTKHSVSSYPDMSRTDAPKICSLNLDQCFAIEGNTTRADTFFKRVAFEQPNCGDCLIYHLVNLSGDLGLSAFLPPAESQFPVNASTVNSGVEPTPFLPLCTEWGSSDFSLSNVAFETGWPGHSRRQFAMRLIQRYSYIMGSSPIEFAALKSPKQAAETIGNLNRTDNAFICVNDDITSGQEQISKTFSSWLHYAFPDALPYELAD